MAKKSKIKDSNGNSKLLYTNYYESVNYTDTFKEKPVEISYEIDDTLANKDYDIVLEYLNNNINIEKKSFDVIELNEIFKVLLDNFVTDYNALDSVDIFNIISSYMNYDEKQTANMYNDLSYIYKYRLIDDMVNNRGAKDNKELVNYYNSCKNSGRRIH